MAERPFPGFYAPEYTTVPNDLLDELLPDLSGAELKVLLYIVRQTFGWHMAEDAISLTELERGRSHGRHRDRGTGLSRKTLYQAVASLEAKGCLDAERRASAAGDADVTVYRLRVIEKKLHTGRGEIPPRR